MSDADIVKALRASIKFDAIHGTAMERAICGSQMIRAADEITSLRTELAATPQWRDKPTIPGVYFSSIRGVETLKQWDIDDWPNRYIKVRIFGPIPTDTPKETGE